MKSKTKDKKMRAYTKFLNDIRNGKIKQLDVLNLKGFWRTGQVKELLVGSDEVQVSFDQLSAEFDELIQISSGRLAPKKSKVKARGKWLKGVPLFQR